MSEKGFVRSDRNDGGLTITLQRPPSNLLTEVMIQEVAQTLEKVRGDDHLKLVRIRSAVPAMFSKGFDYAERVPGHVGPLIVAFGHLLSILNEVQAIVACEIDGPCLGGSLELASFCDIVVASDRSTFGHPEIRNGIFPPVAAALYPHLMGRNRTIELLATGRILDAEEACTCGLVNRVFPKNLFETRISDLYEDIERCSALSLRLMKKAIESALYEKVLIGMRITENIYLNELLPSHDAREGIQAVLENRLPHWKNR